MSAFDLMVPCLPIVPVVDTTCTEVAASDSHRSTETEYERHDHNSVSMVIARIIGGFVVAIYACFSRNQFHINQPPVMVVGGH